MELRFCQEGVCVHVQWFHDVPCIAFFLSELEVCRMVKESAKAAERRKKTVIVGDLQPLTSALPDLPLSSV